ncbi:MAG: FG-GAP-like repeat-containing protein, partial [Myxococcota bacterium]
MALVVGVALGLALGCGESDSGNALARNQMLAAPDADAQKLLDTVVQSEELIEGLRGAMGQLAFSAANLELPDVRSRELFWPLEVQVRDLAAEPSAPDAPEPGEALEALRIDTRHWEPADLQTITARELTLWKGLFERVDHFENTKFKIKRGRYLEVDDGPPRFETEVRFTGLAVAPDGGRSWIKSKQKLRWRLLPGKDVMRPEHWRIEGWETVHAEQMDAPELLFEEVVDYAVPDPEQRERARFNVHERLTAQRILASRAGERIELPMPPEDWLDFANDRQPGVAVADVDRDGFDDVYVMNRLGRNQLFLNQGDGRFVEAAARFGVDVDSHSAAALFADFDNDGDDDLFLGRTERRSQYFENEDGRFVDRSGERFDLPLPYLVSSLSAADYDGDGLLDLYITTYSSHRINSEQPLHSMPEAEVNAVLERREER